MSEQTILLLYILKNPSAVVSFQKQFSCTSQTAIKAINAGGEIVGELNHLVSCPTQENTSQFTFHG